MKRQLSQTSICPLHIRMCSCYGQLGMAAYGTWMQSQAPHALYINSAQVPETRAVAEIFKWTFGASLRIFYCPGWVLFLLCAASAYYYSFSPRVLEMLFAGAPNFQTLVAAGAPNF